jgi:hypothetical protein
MKVISVRQPWAWAIIHGGKDIENRSWKTTLRGRVFIHAAKKIDNPSTCIFDTFGVLLTDKFLTGGIIGSVDIVDCVTSSESKWFFGPYGFVLKNPISLDFFPCRGQLGFFDFK